MEHFQTLVPRKECLIYSNFYALLDHCCFSDEMKILETINSAVKSVCESRHVKIYTQNLLNAFCLLNM